MDLRADVEAVVKAALLEFNEEKEREWIKREADLRQELKAALDRELSVATDESKQWEAKYRAVLAEAESARAIAVEESRLQTLKNLASTIHEIESRCEEKILLLEEQLKRAEDALIAHTLHAPLHSEPTSVVLPVVEASLPEVTTAAVAQQRIAVVEAQLKARKEDVVAQLRRCNTGVTLPTQDA